MTEKDPLNTKDILGASSSTSRYDDEHTMQAEPEHKASMYDGANAHGMARSEYDDEHVIVAPTPQIGAKARLWLRGV